MGRCIKCGMWDSLKSVDVGKSKNKKNTKIEINRLQSRKRKNILRKKTGFSEFDRVLGGGLVQDEVILLGGEPGIGKTSLLMKLLDNLHSKNFKVVYVSAEESFEQLQIHAKRLGVKKNIDVITSNDVDNIINSISGEKYDFLIVDSVQTIKTDELKSVVGGLGQVKECTSRLVQYAKSSNTSVVLVGHITKGGELAGPKAIEHIVDAVLILYGEEEGNLRFLKASKNRFGSTQELGVFNFINGNFSDVKNPSEVFTVSKKPMIGICKGAVFEGRRGIVVEVQTLTTRSSLKVPQRIVSGFRRAKVQMLCALLTKYTKADFLNKDVYVNLANGINVNDSSLDLCLCIALISSYHKKKVSNNVIALGEVSLTGQIKSTTAIHQKLKFLCDQRYEEVIIPGGVRIHKTKRLSPLRINHIREIYKKVGL